MSPEPSTIPVGNNAVLESNGSNRGTNRAQRIRPAQQSKLPKDSQTAAIPEAGSSAANTDDASNSKNSAASAVTGGAANDLRVANKSEVSIGNADITGTLIENRTASTNATEKMMEIVLKNGRVLRTGRDIDPETLLRTILVLER
jgi:hypothetical protein